MEVAREATQRQQSHRDAILLCVGQPATPAPGIVREAAARAVRDEVLGYTVSAGRDDLRAAIAAHYRDLGADVSPEQMTTALPLLYQSGYLTIKGFDPRFNLYTLGFPNMEVKDGFLNFLLGYYAPIQSDSTNTLISLMSMDVESGNPEDFMTRLDALFARTNYQIQGDCEKDFQYAMYIIIELMGEYVETERTTSNGRIDILIKTKDYVYIIEIKTDSTPDEALAQIEEKGYARPFADDRRRIFRVGVNFSTANRRIDGWKVIG